MRGVRLATALLLGAALTAAAPAAAVPGRLVILDDVRIDGPVQGDVVALGGNVLLGPHARVEGHAVAVLGRVEAAGGATVTGQRISVTSLAGLKVSRTGSTVSPRVVWGVRLLTLGFWLLLAALLSVIFPARIVRGVWTVNRFPAGSLGLGVLAALTLMAALVAVFSAGTALGLPGAVALLLLFGAAKALGVTLIGGLIGGPVLRRVTGRRFPMALETPLGVALLLALRIVPVVGGALWAVASVWGLGAAVVALAVNPMRQGSRVPLTPED